MTTSSENALMDGRGPAPLWVWLLVLALGALVVYAGYTAVSNYQLYYDTETARQAVARDKDRLEANVADLKRQIEQADAVRTEAETALKQSRADTATASAQIGDLQGQVSARDATIKSLEAAVAAAESKAVQAADAKTALQNEIDGLKARLDEMQTKLDQALADLQAQRQQSQSQPPPPQP
jgi:chromosome segregation ATPase